MTASMSRSNLGARRDGVQAKKGSGVIVTCGPANKKAGVAAGFPGFLDPP